MDGLGNVLRFLKTYESILYLYAIMYIVKCKLNLEPRKSKK